MKLSERSKEEVEELLNIWEDADTKPFLLGLETFINLTEKIKVSQKVIEVSENPRLIILETWLIIDFAVRHLLTVGLELDRFESDNLSFLPLSNRDCLRMLKNLITDQRNKPIDPSRKALLIPGGFLTIIGNDKDFFDKFLSYNREYDKKVGVTYDGAISNLNNPNYRNVSDFWFNMVSRLDEKWFKSTEKINKVRNFAAHSFEENVIYIQLGIKGKNKIGKLKEYCKKTLNEIIGIK